MNEPLHMTSLLAHEFRQSLRFQVWRRAANPREGFAQADAQAALNQFESDLATGIAVLAPSPFQDVLHVATALHLGAPEFLTFDASQRRLATAEKLIMKP